jgi:hypothetical protein
VTNGVDKVQEAGQCVNVICDVVQLMSGLWALSQSVPRIMSWSPMVVM